MQADDRLVFTELSALLSTSRRSRTGTPAGRDSGSVGSGTTTKETVRSGDQSIVASHRPDRSRRPVSIALQRSHCAIHRNGERLTTKIGDVSLESGDTLLLQVGSNFAQAHRNNPDFYLVSDVAGSQSLRHDRGGLPF